MLLVQAERAACSLRAQALALRVADDRAAAAATQEAIAAAAPVAAPPPIGCGLALTLEGGALRAASFPGGEGEGGGGVGGGDGDRGGAPAADATHVVPGYVATLDWILYDPAGLRAGAIAPPPPWALIRGGLPNKQFPSDHLSICADLHWCEAAATAVGGEDAA